LPANLAGINLFVACQAGNGQLHAYSFKPGIPVYFNRRVGLESNHPVSSQKSCVMENGVTTNAE